MIKKLSCFGMQQVHDLIQQEKYKVNMRATSFKLSLLLGIAALTGITTTNAAISVGASGSAVQDFATLPTVAQGWSYKNITGAAGAPADPTAMDALVQTNAATD